MVSPLEGSHGELIGWDSLSVRLSTFSNMNILETKRPIAIKLDLEQHWGGGKATLGAGPDRIRTLVP